MQMTVWISEQNSRSCPRQSQGFQIFCSSIRAIVSHLNQSYIASQPSLYLTYLILSRSSMRNSFVDQYLSQSLSLSQWFTGSKYELIIRFQSFHSDFNFSFASPGKYTTPRCTNSLLLRQESILSSRRPFAYIQLTLDFLLHCIAHYSQNRAAPSLLSPYRLLKSRKVLCFGFLPYLSLLRVHFKLHRNCY